MDWNVGSAAMVSAAVSAGMNDTHVFGIGSYGSDASNMGKCYDIKIDGAPRNGLFQVINQGGDVSSGQFDLFMGDGGFGIFDACAAPTTGGSPAMYSGDKSAFGRQYGGWANKADCSKLPSKPSALSELPPGEPDLVRQCELGFEYGVKLEGGGNPKIVSATRVPCPESLVKLTGVRRTDDSSTETHGAGTLTSAMDCCKPSAGWKPNVQNPDPAYPAVIPCTSDGYTRIKVTP